MPLPPDITIFADVNSGLSELDNSDLRNFDKSVSPDPLIDLISALPPVFSEASKAVDLTVIIFILSLDLTVDKAFPAYIGL